MRCFVSDGQTISPGFPFNDLNGIDIAGQRVPFDESLIHSPIGHMGHHIVNCDVQKVGESQTISLIAAKHNMWCGDNNDVLLHIQQPIVDGTQIKMETKNNVWRHLENRAHYFVGSIDDSGHAVYWEALVQLRWGSSVTVAEKFTQAANSRRSRSRRHPASNIDVVIETTYAFDGKRITITKKRFQNGVAVD